MLTKPHRTIRIDYDLLEAIRVHARENSRSVTREVHAMLKQALANATPPQKTKSR